MKYQILIYLHNQKFFNIYINVKINLYTKILFDFPFNNDLKKIYNFFL